MCHSPNYWTKNCCRNLLRIRFYVRITMGFLTPVYFTNKRVEIDPHSEHSNFKMCYFPFFKICLFLFCSVKYMREATPYVKKGSPVSEIGWESPPPESPRLGSPPITSLCDPPSPPTQPSLSLLGDRRCIPLKMCYVTRAMTTPDPENR